MKISIVFLPALLALGCSTQKMGFIDAEVFCQNRLWSELGYQSALDGEPIESAYQSAKQDCSDKNGVNKKKHADGYAKGLEKFCTQSYGRQFAKAGMVYQSTCPKNLESAFLVGYESGRTFASSSEAWLTSAANTMTNERYCAYRMSLGLSCDADSSYVQAPKTVTIESPTAESSAVKRQ